MTRASLEGVAPSPGAAPPVTTTAPPRVEGKFLWLGDEKFYVRGVTYGTFEPRGDAGDYPERCIVERDFRGMAARGFNAVRTYTVPPTWLLDVALEKGLRVMVGLPWEQHTAFLDSRATCDDIERRVRLGVRSCAGHAALLCYAIGNEIPAPIVRLHGRGKVQGFLRRLFDAVKEEDPGALVTYVNFPSTEYLDLPFLDFASFNVYLESEEKLRRYVARLQNLVGDRPLVLTEIGLDSRRNGVEVQASSLTWQIREAFAGGSAGVVVFSWTDEWHRGGYNIEDWDFGLTTRDRQPKPALAAVEQAFSGLPIEPRASWPRISVVVCTYNGSRTIAGCLASLATLNYPDYEVILVNDGSTDDTAAIASTYPCKLISTENRGLSSARNTGLQAATGEIIAYIDDDARADPDWLTYLGFTFATTGHVAVGGPNIPPPGDGFTAGCVANSPGGPLHVLLSDQEAEHIPGCNMAFRRSVLESIGGFDPVFRVAGDDVDVCWRLRDRGWTIGFHHAAMVWHHRRNSVAAYWRQQVGYGRAEALLERKWPGRYNRAGHLSWAGRVYGAGNARTLGLKREQIFQGSWGSAPFQSLYQPSPGMLSSLPQMPEWHLATVALAALGLLGFAWSELLLVAVPLLVLSVAIPSAQAGFSARHVLRVRTRAGSEHARLRGPLTFTLHMMQPIARLWGRARNGLTPWRIGAPRVLRVAFRRTIRAWSGHWQGPEQRLTSLQDGIRGDGVRIVAGGPFDGWDLEVRGGFFGTARLLLATEEHGGGVQCLVFRSWCRLTPAGVGIIAASAGLAAAAALFHAWAACAALAVITGLLIVEAVAECGGSSAVVLRKLAFMSEERE